MLYTAGKQWFSAARLCKKLNRLPGEEQTELPTINIRPFWSRSETPARAVPLQQPRETKYSLLYGYFVTMGGFIVDVSHLHNTLSRLTISPKGLYFLAMHGHFVNISDDAIRDKSKADMLAKALVCIQVGWMFLQTVARRIVGYPITLLEVHALVHVACAIAMYGLWFKKPQDIRDPAWVNTSEFEDLLALMLVRNYGFGTRVRPHDQEKPVPIKSVEHTYSNGSESAYLHVYPTSEKGKSIDATGREMQEPEAHWSSSAIPNVIVHHEVTGCDYSFAPSVQGPAVCSVMSGQALECGIGPAMSVHSLWGAQEEHQHGGHLQIALTPRDVRRWTLAAQASRRIGEELYRDSPRGSVNYFTFYTHSIFLDRKGLQAGFYAYFCAWASGGLIAALTVCMFYGAAHVTAWSFVFPTDVERLLWRIACIDTIAGVISLLAIFSIVVFLHEHGQKLFLKSFFTWESGVLSLLCRLVILVGVLNFPLFILSRIYIITESFISLRHVKLGVYQTVQWTDYIPHI